MTAECDCNCYVQLLTAIALLWLRIEIPKKSHYHKLFEGWNSQGNCLHGTKFQHQSLKTTENEIKIGLRMALSYNSPPIC